MIKLNRISNWPTLLGHFFASNSEKPFVWGEWDCALMAADAVKVMTDHDYAEALRFQYTDAKGAMRLIEPHGDLRGLIEHLLGSPITNHRLIQRGDVAVVDNEGRQCTGIVWGSGIFATGEKGLVSLPMSSIIAAWRI